MIGDELERDEVLDPGGGPEPRSLRPEQRLAAAVLGQSLLDLERRRGSELYRTARRWFLGKRAALPFDVVAVFFRVDPGWLRRSVTRELERKRRL